MGPRARRIAARVERLDWGAVESSLDDRGYALTESPLLTARECAALAAQYDQESRFRATIDMARHGFGVGEYRYFAQPLPEPVATLRRLLYGALAPIANRWQRSLGRAEHFPPEFAAFVERCWRGGQLRPTPLLLRYRAGGYNCLHQDVYGKLAFPFQATLLLSALEAEFTGGEFLLVEQRPRRQSRGSAVRLDQGQAVIFPNAERPVRGGRGFYRCRVRHGVSEVRSGTRLALGLIFHDAR